MKTVVWTLSLGALVVATFGSELIGRDVAPGSPEAAKPQPAEAVKIARPVFHLTVQKDARLPAGDRPEATAPAGDGRLSVSIQPERKQFPANGPITVTVTLKNVSEKPFRLHDVDRLGARPEMLFVHVKTASQIRVGRADAVVPQPKPADKPAPEATSVLLGPGQSIARTVVVEAQPVFVAPPPGGPIPLPMPVPQPRAALDANAAPDPNGVRKDPAPPAAAPAAKGPAADEAIEPPGRRPGLFPRPIGVPAPGLLPEGTVRMRLTLEFAAPAGIAGNEPPHWTGRLATETAEVEFTPVVVRPPVVVPPVQPPTNREQAIPIAHRAAEAALRAAYNPVDPVRPPHQGDWISEPAKTAEVKDRAGGGWTISWTHTPKGKGHNYHVAVDVLPAGNVTVREVFAGYSPR